MLLEEQKLQKKNTTSNYLKIQEGIPRIPHPVRIFFVSPPIEWLRNQLTKHFPKKTGAQLESSLKKRYLNGIKGLLHMAYWPLVPLFNTALLNPCSTYFYFRPGGTFFGIGWPRHWFNGLVIKLGFTGASMLKRKASTKAYLGVSLGILSHLVRWWLGG